MYSVYLHITPSSKAYCGITKQKPTKRWANGKGYANSPRFSKAIQKYGWDAIEHYIIIDGLSREEAGAIEKSIIDALNLTDPHFGYNGTLGGEFGAKFLDETKTVMSQKAKDRWENEEYRANQIAKHSGKEMPDAVKRKIAESNRGQKRTEESKRKMSEVQRGLHKKGHSVSDETKAKISESKRGKHYGGTGRTAREVLCVETGERYKSAKEVAEMFGSLPGSVNDACHSGKRFHGFHWQYAN